MREIIFNSAQEVARASDGNPIISTGVVILFYLGFTIVEGMVEKLITGDYFLHWLDPIFTACFMAYAAYCVYHCALRNTAIAIYKAPTTEDK